jgi:hypothetical protein
VHRERVRERGEAGVEGAPCGLERLLGLQYDREFREVEATHIDERARPLLGRHAGRMGKGVAHLAQCHQPKRRRQVERGS